MIAEACVLVHVCPSVRTSVSLLRLTARLLYVFHGYIAAHIIFIYTARDRLVCMFSELMPVSSASRIDRPLVKAISIKGHLFRRRTSGLRCATYGWRPPINHDNLLRDAALVAVSLDRKNQSDTIELLLYEAFSGAENLPPCARLLYFCRAGFIFRLSGDDKTTLHGEALVDATHEAMENLRRFWVVGIVEQYAGFIEVLKRLLDPERRHEALWKKYSRRRLNP